MDFFSQGIPLGRWFRINVIIHWTFVLFAFMQLMDSSGRMLGLNIMFMVLLFGTVLLHEFGHALACRAVGGQANQIILWPLGGIAFVQPPMNPRAWLITTVCGPLVNAVLWPLFWALTTYVMVPAFEKGQIQGELGLYLVIACENMVRINMSLLIFNLIPAYPMDGGRILQEILWFIIGYKESLRYAGMVGIVAGVVLILLGLGAFAIRIPVVDYELGTRVSPMLCVIGLLSAMGSMGIYRQAQTLDGWQQR
jgi:Zn-dependent protease